MTTSIRDQLLARTFTQLSAGGKPSFLNVERFRLLDVEDKNLPHTNIRPVREGNEMQRDRGALTIHTLEFVLEHRAKGTDSVSPDAAVDKLISWATAQVMASITQGGLAKSTHPGEIEWDANEGAGIYLLAKQPFTITYQTLKANQEART